jgi:hypothetical protein
VWYTPAAWCRSSRSTRAWHDRWSEQPGSGSVGERSPLPGRRTEGDEPPPEGDWEVGADVDGCRSSGVSLGHAARA